MSDESSADRVVAKENITGRKKGQGYGVVLFRSLV